MRAVGHVRATADASIVRERLMRVLDGGLRGWGDPLDVQQQDHLAGAIRTACHDVGRARASNSRMLYAIALPLCMAWYAAAVIWPFVVVREQWNISVGVRFAVSLATVSSLSLLFLLVVLRAKNDVPRTGKWSRFAMIFATLAVTTVGGLASLIATLTIHYPGPIAGVAIAAPAPWCVLFFLVIPLAASIDILWCAVHWPADPRSVAQLALLHALSTLQSHKGEGNRGRALTDHERRRAAAVLLERAANRVERAGTLAPSIGNPFGRSVKTTLAFRSKSVAAGFRRFQNEALWPEESTTDIVVSLEQGLIDSCSGVWSTLECAPSPDRASVTRLIAIRALVSATLVGIAWIAPVAFKHLLSDTASNTLRLILIITAITSALAPRHAIATAADLARALTEGSDRRKS